MQALEEWQKLPPGLGEVVKRLQKIYKSREVVERGSLIAGHRCITPQDVKEACARNSDLLYGEVLPSGVDKMLDANHLNAGNARVLYDLGMGLGKAALQAHLQYPNLVKIVGVELAFSRAEHAFNALRQASAEDDRKQVVVSQSELVRIVAVTGATVQGKHLEERKQEASKPVRHKPLNLIEFRRQNLFDAKDASEADILILETKFNPSCWVELALYLTSTVKMGARMLTYENLNIVYQEHGLPNPFEQLEINVGEDDRFFTSWATKRGHHFFIWRRIK